MLEEHKQRPLSAVDIYIKAPFEMGVLGWGGAICGGAAGIVAGLLAPITVPLAVATFAKQKQVVGLSSK